MAEKVYSPSVEEKRIETGIAFWRARGEEIERFQPHTYRVPSSTDPERFYTVELDKGFCSCPDYAIRREQAGWKVEPCLHIYTCEIIASKKRAERARGAA